MGKLLLAISIIACFVTDAVANSDNYFGRAKPAEIVEGEDAANQGISDSSHLTVLKDISQTAVARESSSSEYPITSDLSLPIKNESSGTKEYPDGAVQPYNSAEIVQSKTTNGPENVSSPENIEPTMAYSVPSKNVFNDAKQNTTNNSAKNDLGYILLVWGIIVVLGIVLGWNEKIVIFRNYNDLAIVFGSGLLVYAAIFVIFLLGNNGASGVMVLSLIMVASSAGLMIYLIFRTFVDNRSILATVLALITKLSLSVLFLINLLTLLSPSGKTQVKRAKNKASALAWLMVITPIIYALVRDKEGIFSPGNIFNQYQRRKIGI